MTYFSQLTGHLMPSDFETKHYRQYPSDLGISPGTYEISKEIIDVPNGQLHQLCYHGESALRSLGSVYLKNGKSSGNLSVSDYISGNYDSWKKGYLSQLDPYVYFVLGNVRFRTPLPDADVLRAIQHLKTTIRRLSLLECYDVAKLLSLNKSLDSLLRGRMESTREGEKRLAGVK